MNSNDRPPPRPHSFKHIEDGHISRFPETMNHATIEKIRALMQSLLWTLDLVEDSLGNSCSAAFCRRYKTPEYMPAVKFLTKQLKIFIQAYLDREYPKLDYDRAFSGQLNFTITDMHDPPIRSGYLACGRSRHSGSDMLLDPEFWAQSPSTLTEFCDPRTRYMSQDTRTEQCAHSQELTLLHELVHMASRYCFEGFLGTCNLKRAGLPKALRFSLILDVALLSIATPEEAASKKMAAVQGWHETRGYGRAKCELLAKLDQGALGSLLNADSYMLFAGQVAGEHLGSIHLDYRDAQRKALKAQMEAQAAAALTLENPDAALPTDESNATLTIDGPGVKISAQLLSCLRNVGIILAILLILLVLIKKRPILAAAAVE